MSIDELRKCIVAVPFVTFTLNMADGRRIPVIGRDFISSHPKKDARWWFTSAAVSSTFSMPC